MHGDQRGRQLGFPTANLIVVDDDSIADGVYAAWVTTADGEEHQAAVSIGRRVTFMEDGVRLLEAHLLDFDSDLYDQVIHVDLTAWVRFQCQFSGVDQLVQQLTLDVECVRNLLARNANGDDTSLAS